MNAFTDILIEMFFFDNMIHCCVIVVKTCAAKCMGKLVFCDFDYTHILFPPVYFI